MYHCKLLALGILFFCLGTASLSKAENQPSLPEPFPENYRIDEIKQLGLDSNGSFIIAGMGENQDKIPRPGQPMGYRFIRLSLPGENETAKHCFDLAKTQLLNGSAGSNQSGMSLYINKSTPLVCSAQTVPSQPRVASPPILAPFDPFSVAIQQQIRTCPRGSNLLRRIVISCELKFQNELRQ